MMRYYAIATVVFALILPASAHQEKSFEGSPFTHIKFENSHVKVEHDGREYYLVSIDGIKIEDIFTACIQGADDGLEENTRQDWCQSMFSQKFVELLSGLKIERTDWWQVNALKNVDLTLYYFETHEVIEFTDVEVTKEKLDLVIKNQSKKTP